MNTFRLVITTQILENYGAHAWNGEGECPQYWKFKGGNEYIVAKGNLRRVIRAWKNRHVGRFSHKSEYWEEYPINTRIYTPGEETPDEKMHREMREWGWE